MDNMMRTTVGPLNRHKSLRYMKVDGKKHRYYDVVTTKADLELV